jgi:uncharacterized protein HemX
MMKHFLVISFLLGQVAIAADVQSDSVVASAVASPATTEGAVAAAGTKLPEDQIPLTIEASKKPVEGGSTTARALMSMAIVLILTGTGYYFVRRYKFSIKLINPTCRLRFYRNII